MELKLKQVHEYCFLLSCYYLSYIINTLTSNIESNDSTVDILNNINKMASELESGERSYHSQWFEICSFISLVTDAKVRDSFCLVTST